MMEENTNTTDPLAHAGDEWPWPKGSKGTVFEPVSETVTARCKRTEESTFLGRLGPCYDVCARLVFGCKSLVLVDIATGEQIAYMALIGGTPAPRCKPWVDAALVVARKLNVYPEILSLGPYGGYPVAKKE